MLPYINTIFHVCHGSSGYSLASRAGDRTGLHSHQCGICGGQTRNGTRFCLRTSVLICQYRSTKAL